MKSVRNTIAKTPIGIAIVLLFFLVALVGPWIAPYDPLSIDLLHEYESPSRAHWLGTGDNGIDVLSALLHGARLAAVVSVATTAVSPIIW
jgi:peptide/nickel transport system permease protein